MKTLAIDVQDIAYKAQSAALNDLLNPLRDMSASAIAEAAARQALGPQRIQDIAYEAARQARYGLRL